MDLVPVRIDVEQSCELLLVLEWWSIPRSYILTANAGVQGLILVFAFCLEQDVPTAGKRPI